MPELPEVETTVMGLKKQVVGRTITRVWVDLPGRIKLFGLPGDFTELVSGCQIKDITRRGKWILFYLTRRLNLLLHQKMTGHLLVGKWCWQPGGWEPEPFLSRTLLDPVNRYLRLIFFLNDGWQLGLSDLRRFARIELLPSKCLADSLILKSLGPDALTEVNQSIFRQRMKGRKGKIKSILLDQKVIAGLGNIYTDEILFHAGIHPATNVAHLSCFQLGIIYRKMKSILKCAIAHRGTSFSDYRDSDGGKGNYGRYLQVYGRAGKQCYRCGQLIQRMKIGSRTASFCPGCQKLYC
ncbi:MAG: DNA-formamidopyrimidine glycosylase [Candidatus Omnitrophica bacterium]|nr:DNA-formamidopyrimidine glycosylase [Candidatus Omnitrophota bacterium]